MLPIGSPKIPASSSTPHPGSRVIRSALRKVAKCKGSKPQARPTFLDSPSNEVRVMASASFSLTPDFEPLAGSDLYAPASLPHGQRAAIAVRAGFGGVTVTNQRLPR